VKSPCGKLDQRCFWAVFVQSNDTLDFWPLSSVARKALAAATILGVALCDALAMGADAAVAVLTAVAVIASVAGVAATALVLVDVDVASVVEVADAAAGALTAGADVAEGLALPQLATSRAKHAAKTAAERCWVLFDMGVISKTGVLIPRIGRARWEPGDPLDAATLFRS